MSLDSHKFYQSWTSSLSIPLLLRITFLCCIFLAMVLYCSLNLMNLQISTKFNRLESGASKLHTRQQRKLLLGTRDFLDQSNVTFKSRGIPDDYVGNAKTLKFEKQYPQDEQESIASLSLPRSSILWSRLLLEPVSQNPNPFQNSTRIKNSAQTRNTTPSQNYTPPQRLTSSKNLLTSKSPIPSLNHALSKNHIESQNSTPSLNPAPPTSSQLVEPQQPIILKESGHILAKETIKHLVDTQWRKSPFLKFPETSAPDKELTPRLDLHLKAKKYRNLDLVTTRKSETKNAIKTFATVFPCDKGEPNCYLQTKYPVDRCPHRCKQTFNLTEADVVVIYVFKIARDEIVPDFKRPPGQRWVMFDTEPPCRKRNHSMLDLPKLKGQFNWTLSYRLDADIPWLYGYLRMLEDPATKDYNAIYRRKSVTAAWFVGHCSTGSQRDVYVQYMQDYGGLDVHIYGACGNYTCQGECKENSASCNKARLKRGSDDQKCLPLLSERYFFYLAFENSLCKDYVTEKFFKIFKNVDTIPVIRGGADHKRLFPPNTYVDAADFATPAELAVHLKKLSKDKRRYAEMLKEKDKYRFQPSGKWFCKLCEKMHSETANRVQWYPDLRAWYVDGQCRLPSDLIPTTPNTSIQKD